MPVSRRTVAAGLAAAGATASVGALAGSGGAPAARQPAIYVPHGGGPWPWVPAMRTAAASLETYLAQIPASLPSPPRAVLCVTAHWEARVPTVSTSSAPPMLYDYGGFPENTYAVQWPAAGDPGVAARVRELLHQAGIASAQDDQRGFDHGTFVPLSVAWPDADVAVVQLSLVQGLDPDVHLRIGKALQPLRDEGVLIMGSGMSYHNMRGFGALMRGEKGPVEGAEAFDAWLAQAMGSADPQAALSRWVEAPGARAAHPREEHLLPLMVVAGAAGGDVATVAFADRVLGAPVRAVQFG